MHSEDYGDLRHLLENAVKQWLKGGDGARSLDASKNYQERLLRRVTYRLIDGSPKPGRK
jgi:hypothetical protein